MASDGQVVIDLSLRRDGIQSDIEWLENNLKNLGANVNADGISEKFEDAMQDAKQSVDKTIDGINKEKAKPKIGADDSELDEKTSESKSKLKSVSGIRATAKLKADAGDLLEKAEHSKSTLKKLPKSVKTEIIAQAKDAGILNFEKILNRLPKEVKTSIIADVRDGKAIDFEETLKKVPKEKRTALEVDDYASEPLQKMTGGLDKADKKTKGFTETLKGTAVGMGVYNAAMKVGSAVSNEFAGAISRYDTLNNYPKVLESMGASANDANASMKTLKNGVDGLPTSLDSVAKASQRFLPMSKNADDAAKSALALNDAFLASGASSEDASRGLEQYTQMLSSGKVDMQSWRTLEETMPASLKKVSESFGVAGGSAKGLYEKLQSGEITMNQLNQKFQELDGGAKGFHETALSATGGIGTAFANLENRVKASIANAMSGFDQFVKKITGNTIAENINKMSSHFGDFGTKVGQSMSKAGDTLKPFSAVLGIIGTNVGLMVSNVKAQLSGFTTAFHANFISPSKDAQKAIENLKGGISKFGESIKPIFTQIGSLMGILSANAFRLVGDAVKGVASGFDGLNSSMKGIDLSGFQKALANVGVAFNQIIVAVEPLVISLGKVIGIMANGAFKAFGDIMHGLSNAVSLVTQSMSKLDGSSKTAQNIGHSLDGITSHKEGLELIGKAIGTVTTALLGLKIVKTVSNIFSNSMLSIKNSVGKVGKAFITLTNILKVNPFLAITAAIATVTMGLMQLYQHNAKFKAFVDGIVKNISTLIKNISKVASTVTKDFVGAFNKLAAPVKKAFQSIMKTIQPQMKQLQKIISDTVKNIQKAWDTAWKTLSKIITPIFKTISKFVSQHMTQIKNVINSSLKIISTIWSTIWKSISNVFKLTWDMIFNKSKVINDIKRIIDTSIKAISTVWKNTWNIIKNVFDVVWDAIKNIAKGAINFVKNIIESTIRSIQNTWNKIWNSISDFFSDIWNDMKRTVSNAINNIHDSISSTLNRISSVWKSMWGSLKDFFGSIWDDIKKFAQDGINGVINVINAGIDGIDSVWKFFTGKETSIHHLKPVHFAQGGIVDRHLSMVNDGDGEDWKELIETPDGELMMSNERNAILPLEAGTRVYNGAETRQIMSMLGVDHYANGGIVGGIQHFKDGGVVSDIIDWGAHELKDFGSWIKDKWDAVTKFLKHPIENTKAIIKKAITGPLGKLGNQNMVDLGQGVFDKLTKPIADWFKKGLEEAKKKHDEESVGGFGNIKDMKNSAELRELVKAALEANGLSTSEDMIARVMRQIATESGGNAHAVQPGADPDGDGSGPAMGLMQTKRGTFNAYKAPGHDDIFNAYDNLLAALNYAKHRYGPSLSFLGNGHGYDNGGVVNQKELAWLAENNREYVINPQRPTADLLLKRAAEERLEYEPNSAVAQAIAGMNVARNNNGTVAPNTIINSGYINSSNAINGSNDSRLGNIFVDIDGMAFAQAMYPYSKVIQGQDIKIQTRKGGVSFG